MKTYKCIIIDDEQLSIKSLMWELSSIDIDLSVVDTCNTPEEGIISINKYKPDLVFLDIEMPRMNGFEMLSCLDFLDFQVIFTTAYDEYAVKAFEINACDYLLKPVDNNKLKKALNRFLDVQNGLNISHKLEDLFNHIRKRDKSFSKLALSTLEGLEFVRVDQIVRCESSSNYTYVYTIDGKKRLVSKTLASFQENLESNNFYRIHNSHLVNIEFIHKYIRGKTGYIILDDKTTIPVSRTKKGLLDNLIS